ncbi:hypothetical protein J4225_01890 [Candidatus Pacearchaeota archaeon]|nr:hypothetical protein [Candidatus Pacearchaeota archaeon]
MNKDKKVIIALIILSIIIIIPVLLNAQNTTVSVEANIILIPINTTSNESIVSVSVTPDFVYLGDVVVGEISNVVNVSISNTGSVKPAKITAELVNQSDNIFNTLQLKDSSGSWGNIANFTTNVSSTKRIDIRLNLVNFNAELDDDVVGHKNEIKFLAMAA